VQPILLVTRKCSIYSTRTAAAASGTNDGCGDFAHSFVTLMELLSDAAGDVLSYC